MTFLIVEDYVPFARRLALALARHGRVLIATSLAAGLTALYAEPWSALLLDVGLPDGSGLELLRHVRQNAALTSVLVITGNSEPSVKRIAANHGATVLSKLTPLDRIQALLAPADGLREAAVRTWCERYALTRAENLVLSTTAAGFSREAMVAGLAIGAETLKSQIDSMRSKTGHASYHELQIALLQEALGDG